MRKPAKATAMAASVEQMTVGINHIAANAEHAHELGRNSGQLSRDGAAVVGFVMARLLKSGLAANRDDKVVTRGEWLDSMDRRGRDPALRRELLQEVHLALWQSFANYQAQCSLRTWVYRVAHNVGVSHIQRVKTQGGVAPAMACDAAKMGSKQIVNYQADYIFWKAA